jgi:hypothetical protein
MFKNLPFILIVLLLLACGLEPDCSLEQPHDEISVNFYAFKDSTVLIQKFFYVGAVGTDSVFYNSEDSLLSTFQLKLNPTATQVQYLFLSGISSDTLTINYDKKLKWLSEECGPSYSYENLVLAYSTFNALLTSEIIDVQIDENIKIYN